MKISAQATNKLNSALLGITLLPEQIKVLEGVWDKGTSVVATHRGWGRTFLLSDIALLMAWLKPNSRIGCFAPHWTQSKLIYEQIKKLIEGSSVIQTSLFDENITDSSWCFRFNSGSLGCKGSIIKSFPLTDGKHIRGERFESIFVDEFNEIPEDVFNMILRPMSQSEDLESLKILEYEKEQIRRCTLLEESEKTNVISTMEKNYMNKTNNNKLVIFTSVVPTESYLGNLYAHCFCSDSDFAFCNVIKKHAGL